MIILFYFIQFCSIFLFYILSSINQMGSPSWSSSLACYAYANSCMRSSL